jgi:hypothetical protein
MSAHTPGPWWIHGDMPGEPLVCFPVVKAFVSGTKAVTVCRVGNHNAYRRNAEHRDWHNARLIAAAPDLLDAVRAAERTFRHYAELHAAKGPDGADKAARNTELADRMAAAIDKAESRA